MPRAPQRAAQFAFWCVIAVLFAGLSIAHFMQIGRHINGIEERTGARGLNWATSAGGEPIDVFQELDNALVSMDDRISQLNRKNDSTNFWTGMGYALAALAAVASGAFSLRPPTAPSAPDPILHYVER